MNADTTVLECGHAPSPHDGFTTGYGVDSSGARNCYQCCADAERESMIATGRATLYLASGPNVNTYRVTNWSGYMDFTVRRISRGRHNMAGTRIDVDFVGPDRHWWHGTQYGENTQIVHCKRTKQVLP